MSLSRERVAISLSRPVPPHSLHVHRSCGNYDPLRLR
ncbi:hypothetical protein E2C01_055556 [Portunus trituberculatus]|uniref:Uncharacterized protein n=1 Tax=Portunus trituberculatus TaxID=210409 RepID=A0A5B7GY03_PORTR|nr:hypothetical protein [Portunus trituberculatus]